MEATTLPEVVIADNFEEIRRGETTLAGDALPTTNGRSASAPTNRGEEEDASFATFAAGLGGGGGRGGRGGGGTATVATAPDDGGGGAEEWGARQLLHFADVRGLIVEHRVRAAAAAAAAREAGQPILEQQQQQQLPHTSDYQAWKRLCYGRDAAASPTAYSTDASAAAGAGHAAMLTEKMGDVGGGGAVEGRAPLISFIAGFPQTLVQSLIACSAEWAASDQVLPPPRGRWVYALLACLDPL
jgi:hypothetical protein